MSSCQSRCKEAIRAHAIELGADACGFATAESVSPQYIDIYRQWIADGCHGTMGYCAKYTDQRNDPRLLLDGAKTVIVCAFSYYTGVAPTALAARIARYAWGDDYHYVLKDRLKRLGAYITEHYGGEVRITVDTAPMRERYWAQQAGIGFIGINNQLIVPDVGSYVFIGTALWTGEVEPDHPNITKCQGCQACVKACPGNALDAKGGCDARKCLSYLSIEHKGSPTTWQSDTIYGCDRCQEVCPHNIDVNKARIEEFSPNLSILSLSPSDLASMTPSHFKRLTSHSAMNRITLRRLLENLSRSKAIDLI